MPLSFLDEAQNTTREQMKMFLTRVWASASSVVVTGDITQIDLPRGKKPDGGGGARTQKMSETSICYLKDTDVVRHELVRKIINAYDQFLQEAPGGAAGGIDGTIF